MAEGDTGRDDNRPPHITEGGRQDQGANRRDIGADLRALYEDGPIDTPLPQHILDLLVAIEAEAKRGAPAQGPLTEKPPPD